MRNLELNDLLESIQQYDQNYQKILLKEFFIKKALFFVYKISYFGYLVFNGGTCLRILYNLPRLSEDIDMDILGKNDFDITEFSERITYFFNNNLNVPIQYSIKSKGQTLLLKIPILKKIGLSSQSDSDLLYIKFDIQKGEDKFINTQLSPYTKDNLYYIIRHYDKPTLFANKLKAIFGRGHKLFHDQYSYKGRDFFDMIWYLQQGVKPNFAVIQYFLNQNFSKSISEPKELVQELEIKVNQTTPEGIYNDLIGLVADKMFVEDFAQNFKEIFDGLKENLL